MVPSQTNLIHETKAYAARSRKFTWRNLESEKHKFRETQKQYKQANQPTNKQTNKQKKKKHNTTSRLTKYINNKSTSKTWMN